jgi:hypothetical protein
LAPLPSDAELAELLSLIGSGDPAALAPRLPESQRERLDLLAVLGIVRGGFDISFGTPKVSGSSVLVQVRAESPESTVRRWSLRLKRSESGSWVIVAAARA